MEEDNLIKILPKLREELQDIDYEILVIDTQTAMDNTNQVCEKNECKYVNRSGGNHYGDAIRTGITVASKKYIVIMDADGSHIPSDVLKLYSEMNRTNADLVIGSRYCKGGNTENPFILKMMSRLLNLVYKIAFHLPVNDVSDSFRMYRSEQLKKLDLQCDNFDIVEEILILLNIYNSKFIIKEIPIIFHEREFGNSKRDLVTFILSYLKTMYMLMKRKTSAKKLMINKKED